MKKKIREQFLKIRKNKYFELNEKNKSFISSEIKKICIQKKIRRLGFYYPINFEIDIVKVISKIKIKNLKVYLPVVEKNNSMSFREWKSSEPFYVNRFGILEPNKNNKKVKPQVVIVPLVAYDQNKNRLGYGRGFYDRFLNKISNQKKVLSLGMAFSFQRVKKIPTEKHDKKFVGTAKFCSINNHKGIELSRRDDLESLIYTFIFLINKSLPWNKILIEKEDKKDEIYNKILEIKEGNSINDLNNIPNELFLILNYIKNLNFESRPNYNYLIGLLNNFISLF